MDRLARLLPQIVVAPGFAAILFFVYGFILWTGYMSLTKSKMLPNYTLTGVRQYERLFQMDRWSVAIDNLFVFGALFIIAAIVIGCLLAVLLDQKIRAEGVIRTIYLYPMAISFIITGTAWKWIMNPSLGLETVVRSWGWESFRFGWIVDENLAVYALVMAAVWQSAGFVMALFLSALRSVDQDIIKAASLDGASPWQIYLRIILPSMRPVFMSAVVILAHLAIKSFDLVVSLTGGGPGYASTLPANFMYEMTFRRNEIGVGAASAMVMLATVAAIMVPYLYSELRGKKHV
ncbi:carbohydrate ABC transporter permease [Phaeobacter gallaeciensis]|uniref:carbohydrate ABC transporter permease n=1 Tax=Phaeobacter gallaeciensis TaxID=60890 RepID=UPI00237EEF84|nr:sugar ABC transporter permease [Phaeobacter gallaeciensis]MDE4097581.1 sugar ABC transporter permease [Phaeobacter gallaeciensis]MDE4106581.1 sugar ABC transporter permease [Phaeobacter gallaeciensis]MDE4110845.1 sugar ABC transporter permease [Phaeobacter gallaeciensis]MDE4115506.1 sugar ABC transporter permease [Phaeobacter gallaeciensis]MDE4119976.1 sugar ABC transporter permease [Phaeobacter gallaeciensis]